MDRTFRVRRLDAKCSRFAISRPEPAEIANGAKRESGGLGNLRCNKRENVPLIRYCSGTPEVVLRWLDSSADQPDQRGLSVMYVAGLVGGGTFIRRRLLGMNICPQGQGPAGVRGLSSAILECPLERDPR